MPSAQAEQNVQKVYIAFYGRPADPAGLEYWGNQLDSENQNFSAIIDNFAYSTEAIDLYGGLDAGSTIDLIYNQMFGRAPDIAGKNFYVAQLNDPFSGFTLQSITLDVLNGAQNEDAQIINNKLTVATNFTNSLDIVDPSDNANEVAAYSGTVAINEGRALLNNVDETPASLTMALGEINNTIDRLVGRDIDSEDDQIFTLTNGSDDLIGGSGDDLFRGPDAGTLQSSDILDGGDGYDILRAEVLSGAAPIIDNIEEIINNSSSNSTLDMEFIDGELEVWAGNNSVGTHTFENAGFDSANIQYIAAEGTSMHIDFEPGTNLNGSSDALMLGIDDSNYSLFSSAQGNDIEHAILEVISGTANAADLSTTFTSLESVTIGGEGNTQIFTNSASLNLVDATALEGGLSYNEIASTQDMVIHGGSGVDSIYSNAGNDTQYGHDGDDVLRGFTGDDELNGGGGDDTLHGEDNDDILNGDAGMDTLLGGSGTDALNGGDDNDLLTGGADTDEFRFDAGNGADIVTDFAFNPSGISFDKIAFEDGGAISFANSSDTGTVGDDDLHADDFETVNSLFSTTLTPSDYDQKVVYLTGSFSTDDIANNMGGSAEFYLAVNNGDLGYNQIWYDDDWSDTAGRELIADLPGYNLGFLESDFGVF